MDFSVAFALLQEGVTNGAVYSLIALSLVLVFAVTRVIMVQAGEFVSYGALTIYALQAGQTPLTLWFMLLSLSTGGILAGTNDSGDTVTGEPTPCPGSPGADAGSPVEAGDDSGAAPPEDAGLPTLTIVGGSNDKITLADGVTLYYEDAHGPWAFGSAASVSYENLPAELIGTVGNDTSNNSDADRHEHVLLHRLRQRSVRERSHLRADVRGGELQLEHQQRHVRVRGSLSAGLDREKRYLRRARSLRASELGLSRRSGTG